MRFFKIFIWASVFTLISYSASQLYEHFQKNYKKNLECIWAHNEKIRSNYYIEYENDEPIALYGPLDPFQNPNLKDQNLLGMLSSDKLGDMEDFYIFGDSGYSYLNIVGLLSYSAEQQYTANCLEK